MANNWKRVKVDFKTVKLGNFIEPIKTTYSELNDVKYSTVYGVSNTDGICITGKESSKDISKYTVLKEDCFAFNPYRINVGSIGINEKGLKGCVSPAYVVFKTNEKLNPYFLYYYLKSDYGNHLINWYGNRGGVRNALRFDDLCQIDIPDIDLPTQLSLLTEIQNYSATFDNLSHESANQSAYLTKLRQAILQEAIEGKLTAGWRKENPVRKGDPDYDAEALLEKIQAEREKLIKYGKIKKQKPLASIKPEQVPFDLPEGWVWTRLGDISLSTDAGKSFLCKDELVTGKSWGVIKTSAITSGTFIESESKLYTETEPANIKSQIKNGDLLFCRASGSKGLAGRSCIVNKITKNLLLSDKSIRLILSKFIEPTLINHINNGEFGENYRLSLSTNKSTSMNNVQREEMLLLPVPLASIAEQRTIIERVEKAFSMVDELEKQVSERKEKSEQLMQAVLREAFERGNFD